MTQVRLKYLHSFTDRHGHVRFYFRYRGNRWPLPAAHEEGFATAYDALLTEIKSNPNRSAQNVLFMRGSLGWVIEHFIASPVAQGACVRYWPLADIPLAATYVRFRGKSGHDFLRRKCLLLTQNGHRGTLKHFAALLLRAKINRPAV